MWVGLILVSSKVNKMKSNEVSCVVTGEYMGKFCVFIIVTDDVATVEARFVDIVENGDCTIIQCKSMRHADSLAKLITSGTFRIDTDGSLVGDDNPESLQAKAHWDRITNCIRAGKRKP